MLERTVTTIVLSLIFIEFFITSLLPISNAKGIKIDVECTVYEHSDDVNGNNVDVRIFLLALKANYDYTAKVTPDHNPPTNVTSKSDSDGIFWAVAKIPNGEKSLLFSVNIYEGNETNGLLVASGNADAPCFNIPPLA